VLGKGREGERGGREEITSFTFFVNPSVSMFVMAEAAATSVNKVGILIDGTF